MEVVNYDPLRFTVNLLAGPNGPLFAELCTIDGTLPEVIDRVIEEIADHEPSLLAAWRETGLLHKAETYVVYYLIPFHEMLSPSPPNEHGLLAAQLLSCLAWRAFDDGVDGHVSPIIAHSQTVSACIDLIRYVTVTTGVSVADCTGDVARHYRRMAEQADLERREPIPLEDIWTRCSIFLYAPETLARLDQGRVRLFYDYLNYTGLAHDLSDVMSDLGTGVVSLPIQWIAEASETGTLNVTTIGELYKRAQGAVRTIKARFHAAEVATRHPLMHRLLRNADAVFDGH